VKLAAVFLFVVLLLSSILSALIAAPDDGVPALTDNSKVLVVNAAQMAALERRAQTGEAEAQYILGCAYRDGGPLLAQNEAEAVQWFRKSAEQGFAKGEHALAGMYLHGTGVQQDDTEAARWYTKAAQHGNIAAASLGFLYYVGKGLGRSYSRALDLFSKAAQQGVTAAQYALVTAAQYALGVMYRDGKGIRRDPVEAARFHRMAAEKGLAKRKMNSG
jgi:uncharacterized protein